MNVINRSRVPIIVYVEGMSASAATFLTVSAKYRVIAPYATMMIHQYFTNLSGKREKILFESDVLEKITDLIRNIYINHTKLSRTKIDEIMSNDVSFSTNESLRYGLVDKVLKPINRNILNKYFEKNPEYKLKSDILQKKTNFNNIYLYTEGLSSNNTFSISFDTITVIQFILSKNNGNNRTKPILLHLNDVGQFPDINDVIPLINTIILSSIPIYSIIEGTTITMGLLVNIVCYQRLIYKNAYITIDFVETWERAEKYEDVKENTELFRKIIKDILKKYTKLPQNILNNIFKKKYLFTPKDCIKYGICDEII